MKAFLIYWLIAAGLAGTLGLINNLPLGIVYGAGFWLLFGGIYVGWLILSTASEGVGGPFHNWHEGGDGE